jgi:PAS domain S-box-containing protein
MKSIFTPAIYLLNKLKYAQKFLFLGLIIVSIILFLIIMLFQQFNKTIVDSSTHLEGIVQIVKVNDLIRLAQQYRGLSASDTGNGADLSVLFPKKEQEAHIAFYDLIGSLDPAMTLDAGTNNLTDLDNLAETWEKIRKDHHLYSTEIEFEAHTQFIHQLQLLTTIMEAHYRLKINVDLSSSYMIDILVNNIPETTENMGQIRAIVLSILVNHDLSEIQHRQLIILEAKLEQSITDFQYNLTRVIRYSPSLAADINLVYTQLVVEKQNVITLLHDDIYNKQITTTANEFWNEITINIDNLYGLMHQSIAPNIITHIEKRIERAASSLNAAFAVSIFLLLLAIYFMVALYKAFISNIKQINKTLGDYSQGNLNIKINLNTKDEMRYISQSINDMVQRLNESGKQLNFQQNALDQHAIVSITDVKGNITYANNKFLEMSKFSLDELMGENHRIVKSDYHPDSFFKEMWKIIANGGAWHGEVRNKAKDGSPYWVEATITPLLNELGKSEQYIAICTDITAVKLLEQKRNWAANKEQIRAEVSQQLQTQESLKKRFERVLAKLCEFEGINIQQKAGVFLTEDNALHMFATHGKFSDEFILKEQCIHADQCLCGKVLSNGMFKISDDCFTDHEHEHTFTGMVQHGHYIVPLNYTGQTLGVLFLYTDPYPSREPELIDMLSNIGLMMGLAIANENSQKALVKEKAIAETANKAKSEFLSSMSHELRTPLNGILGFAQILESDEETPLTEEQQVSVGYILSSGEHLLNLINDVLELATIEAGKVTLSMESLHLTDVINDSLSLVRPLAQKANIPFHVLSDADFTINADYTKLKQIIINLVSNAIKYNHKEGSVSLEWKSINDNIVRVSVIDTGIGISKDNHHKVFGAFNRLGHENSTIEGTGIGLVVTKDLVELMGGKMGFESVENKGSTFWFELPIVGTVKKPEEVVPVSEIKKLVTEEKQILYVEDNPANRHFMGSLLNKQTDVKLHMVETGELGWKAALEKDFDLILMDVNLSGINGKKLTQKLRTLEQYKQTPIIAVSAGAMSHNIESAEGLFDAYVTKPIRVSELLDTIKKCLDNQKNHLLTDF